MSLLIALLGLLGLAGFAPPPRIGSFGPLADQDGDGYPAWDDCDDTNPDARHGNTEIPYNGVDDDCNRETLDEDLDEDGVRGAEDCDDLDKERSQHWCADMTGDGDGDWYGVMPKGCTAKGVTEYSHPGVWADYYRCWPEGI